MFVTIPISSFPITRRTVTYLRPHFARPAGIDYSVTVTTVYVPRVRTIFTVYLDSSFRGDESKDFVAVNGVAAFGQFIVDTFDIAAYDELVFFRFVGILFVK